jgi:hypothetical protein
MLTQDFFGLPLWLAILGLPIVAAEARLIWALASMLLAYAAKQQSWWDDLEWTEEDVRYLAGVVAGMGLSANEATEMLIAALKEDER